MLESWLGIDVSKARLDVLLVAGGKRRPKAFKNDAGGCRALVAWIGEVQVHACMEATGRYGEVAAVALVEAGHAVSVVNPFQIKSFGKLRLGRSKTDPIDAALIADYCRMFEPPLWVPPTPAMRRLRELVRLRESLKNAVVQWRNRGSAGPLDPVAAEVVDNVIATLEAELVRADAAVREVIGSDANLAEDYRLLTSIPAIGSQAASIILVEMPGPNVLRTARQAVAYAGLNPCHNQSGLTSRPTRISRIGNGNLRRALYLPALCAMRVNPAVRALRDRLANAGRLRPQQVAVAAMRKLLHLCFGVLKTRRPFDPAYPAASGYAASCRRLSKPQHRRSPLWHGGMRAQSAPHDACLAASSGCANGGAPSRGTGCRASNPAISRTTLSPKRGGRRSEVRRGLSPFHVLFQ